MPPTSREDYPLEEAIAALPNLSSGDTAAVLRGALLSGDCHTPRSAARHGHQNAFGALYALLRQELAARESAEPTVNQTELP